MRVLIKRRLFINPVFTVSSAPAAGTTLNATAQPWRPSTKPPLWCRCHTMFFRSRMWPTQKILEAVKAILPAISLPALCPRNGKIHVNLTTGDVKMTNWLTFRLINWPCHQGVIQLWHVFSSRRDALPYQRLALHVSKPSRWPKAIWRTTGAGRIRRLCRRSRCGRITPRTSLIGYLVNITK